MVYLSTPGFPSTLPMRMGGDGGGDGGGGDGPDFAGTPGGDLGNIPDGLDGPDVPRHVRGVKEAIWEKHPEAALANVRRLDKQGNVRRFEWYT